MKKEFKLSLEGLDCANCANKIEQKVNKLDEVEEANVNFSLGRMNVTMKDGLNKQDLINKITEIVKQLEPDVNVKEYIKNSQETYNATDKSTKFKLSLEGLDCANCANKIEKRVNNLSEVKEANINFSLGKLTIERNNSANKAEIVEKVKKIVSELEPDVVVSEDGEKHVHCHDGVCNCSEEEHEEKVNEKSGILGIIKENILFITGTVLYLIAIAVEHSIAQVWVLFIISYLLVGGKVLLTALKNLRRGQIFDENFLMSIATIGAIAIKQYPEAVAVMIFYEIGELFQGYAVNTSRKSITSLMNVRAEYANLLTKDGEIRVKPESVKIDDILVLKPGERVPLDGIIIDGTGSIDTSALTGESMPREVEENVEILSGSINLNSVIKMKVTKTFGESAISRILDMVENAGSRKAETEKFITKFCRYYTPVVVLLAIVLAVVPPFIFKDANFSTWLYRSLSFLVVSCPCALVVSVPLGLFAGIGAASKKGILVKGGNYLEAMKDIDTVVFDKTGTLTKGNFKVTEINAQGISREELLKIAAIGESFSNHPIAQSIVREYGKEIDKNEIKDYEELSGYGIKAVIDNREALIGNYKLMKKHEIKCNEVDTVGTTVYVAINGKYSGNIIIEDEIKQDSKLAIKKLKEIGVKKVVMLTGDNKKVAEKVAAQLGIDEVYSELLPIDKVTNVEKLISQHNKNKKLAFVGDGINDAPVLARADIGVAMGGIGSDAAIEAADVVLMRDNPISLADGIMTARKTNKILWQNISFALGIKTLVLILITFGKSSMWGAVFADVGVTLIAVLNSMRALK
ncbi:heavy metal translocating P-type ATPase [Clostridium sp. SM-530-WT-3G]|uniref:heavy metal translocating P-type ATPase n=1 Tax=Clostridium sp. SM-530-WT-3G TaxID=2725303 RepID=UPI00145D339A|nr:heavy metal translocating P-type ATPase [Clostridium sp. SM-530-WT-3G]NME83125.1 cadmium-translocating P-type ATPase [Clostridium sp. SM-530-WT-3G]